METKNYQDDISHIRSMMERGSRFISLSGLSGVFAGVVAIVGGTYFYFLLKNAGIEPKADLREMFPATILPQLMLSAALVLITAIVLAVFFTVRKSQKKQLPVWTSATRSLLVNLFLPLAVGGIFCLGLINHGLYGLLAPSTLVFYGLALVNAGNYTFTDIKILGYIEILLGIIAMFMLEYGLFIWVLGFGILHVVYGLVMHFKYR